MSLLRRYVAWRQQRIQRYRSLGFRTPRSAGVLMVAFFIAVFTSGLPMPGWFYALLGLVLVVATAAFGLEMIAMARHDPNYRRIVFCPALRWVGGILLATALGLTVLVAISTRS